MRYALAILIMVTGFWYWMQPRDDLGYRGTGDNTMSDAEKSYYIQMFNHAMSHVTDGSSYPWESYNSKGNITPTLTYASKSNSLCRQFKENFLIGQYSGEQQAIACKRKGKAGWCRIKPGNAETCALEDAKPALQFGSLDVGKVDLGKIDIGGFQISIPVPNVPGLGPIDTPDMPDANVEFPMRGKKKNESSAEWLLQ